MDIINWSKVAKFLKDESRKIGGDPNTATEHAQSIIAHCGPFSQTKVMAQRIGKACLTGTPTVILPACPDYGNDGARYTFNGGLGSGVSLLAQRHLDFILPLINQNLVAATLVYADQEANDASLCACAGISANTFRARVLESVHATRTLCASRNLTITVDIMTNIFPTLVSSETQCTEYVRQERAEHLASDATARATMYRTINSTMTHAEMVERTARTAAQYVALGRLASAQGFLVANHTTVNLRWYLHTDVGLLHNAISVY